jgi:uncharacterized membrane protein YeiH
VPSTVASVSTATLLLVLDLLGIAVFAASGALTGVQKQLDIFGVVFLAGATGLGGGFIRDALIGATPAAALGDWRYLAVPAAVGVVGFRIHPTIARLARPLVVLDAAGLGLFAVAGARKALDAGIGAVGACAIGQVTAIGGGIIRDVLVREIPVVLHREIYATAALIGTFVVVVADRLGVPDTLTAVVAIAVTFVIRVVSKWRRWSAPVAPRRDD